MSTLTHHPLFPHSSASSRLSTELIHLILDYALTSPDLGSNGRWLNPGDVEGSKAQWGKGTKASAQLHRKLSLVHRSWTPHVLRSLYHTPRLTSRRSIEFFLWCLTHPQELWGYDGCPVIVPQDEEWDEVLEEVAKVEGSDGVLGVGGEGNTGASASAGPLSSINGNGCSNLMAASMLSGGSKRGGGFNNLQRRNANGNGNGPRTMTEQMLMNAGMLNAMTAMGNLVPDRRRLVKYICFNVGTGRNSGADYMLYSGDWFARVGITIIRAVPDLWGYETEGWCALGCDELVKCTTVQAYKACHTKFRRWSILRNPAQAAMMYAVAQIQPNISIIEWVDLGSHTIQPGPAGLDSLYKILEMYETSLKVFAVRVRGSFSGVGVFDGLAETCPNLKTIMIQIDLISLQFFTRPPPEELTTLFLGMTHGRPLMFHGRKAIEALWELGGVAAEQEAEAASGRAYRITMAASSSVEEGNADEGDGEGVAAGAGDGVSTATVVEVEDTEEENSSDQDQGSRSGWTSTEDNNPGSDTTADALAEQQPGWKWIMEGTEIMRTINHNLVESGFQVDPTQSFDRKPCMRNDSAGGTPPEQADEREEMVAAAAVAAAAHHAETANAAARAAVDGGGGVGADLVNRMVRRPLELWMIKETRKGGRLREHVSGWKETKEVIERLCW